MTFATPCQYASKILRLTERMLEKAKLQEWTEFSVVEAERHAALEALFKHPTMPGALQEVADMLYEVMRLDGESIALGEQAKQQTGKGLTQLNQGKRAINAYSRHSH